MSNLAYNAKGRAGDLQAAAAAAAAAASAPKEEDVESTKNDWMIEEDIREDVTAPKTTKTQVKLDPLQVCLFPTYLTLPEDVLQDDLRHNLQELVSTRFSDHYGDDFSYFAFTDAKIDWHSGDDKVCSKAAAATAAATTTTTTPSSSSEHRNEVFPSSQAIEAAFREAPPCTCALYLGATVMFHHAGERTPDAFVTPQELEPQISSVLNDSLVEALRNDEPKGDERRRPFYTELKRTSVSWSFAERQNGGKLVYLDPPEGGEQQLSEPPVEDAPTTTTAVLDESAEDSTVIDVVTISFIEGNDSQQQQINTSGANAFATKKGKILASVVGAILLVVLLLLFCLLERNKRARSAAEAKDTSTVISHDEVPRDDVDVEIARGGSRRRKRRSSKRRGNSVVETTEDSVAEDDQSEAAQYKRGGGGNHHHHKSSSSSNLLDCVSVGSEWTLATGVTDGVSSAFGLSSNKTMAEMLAAKETFDRDRQITLQKDMLQSEWSGAILPPSGLPNSRVGSSSRRGSGSPYNNNNNNKKPKAKTTTIDSGDATGGGLQFEEATGEGEEIFLMPHAR